MNNLTTKKIGDMLGVLGLVFIFSSLFIAEYIGISSAMEYPVSIGAILILDRAIQFMRRRSGGEVKSNIAWEGKKYSDVIALIVIFVVISIFFVVSNIDRTQYLAIVFVACIALVIEVVKVRKAWIY